MNKLILLLIGLGVFVLYVRYLEKRSVFFPEKILERTPDDYYMPYEDSYLMSGTHRIHGWWVPVDNAKKTILYLHGNAGNISNRLEKISIYHSLGINTFIIDYRGYGYSEGQPTEKGIYEDAKAAYQFLIKEKNVLPTDIIIYGASLGGAVAVDLASQVECGGVILDSTFTSAVDMGRVIYPFVPSFLINIKLDSVHKIEGIKAPLLFLHSKDDRLVPINLGRKLFNAANEPKQFEEMTGDHVNSHFFEYDRYRYVIDEFINN